MPCKTVLRAARSPRLRAHAPPCAEGVCAFQRPAFSSAFVLGRPNRCAWWNGSLFVKFLIHYSTNLTTMRRASRTSKSDCFQFVESTRGAAGQRGRAVSCRERAACARRLGPALGASSRCRGGGLRLCVPGRLRACGRARRGREVLEADWAAVSARVRKGAAERCSRRTGRQCRPFRPPSAGTAEL